MKDGKFDPNDDQTRKDALVGWVGASGSVLTIDGLRKTVENLDDEVENDMKVDGLNYINQECSDGLKPAVKEAINKSLATLVVQLDHFVVERCRQPARREFFFFHVELIVARVVFVDH